MTDGPGGGGGRDGPRQWWCGKTPKAVIAMSQTLERCWAVGGNAAGCGTLHSAGAISRSIAAAIPMLRRWRWTFTLSGDVAAAAQHSSWGGQIAMPRGIAAALQHFWRVAEVPAEASLTRIWQTGGHRPDFWDQTEVIGEAGIQRAFPSLPHGSHSGQTDLGEGYVGFNRQGMIGPFGPRLSEKAERKERWRRPGVRPCGAAGRHGISHGPDGNGCGERCRAAPTRGSCCRVRLTISYLKRPTKFFVGKSHEYVYSPQ